MLLAYRIAHLGARILVHSFARITVLGQENFAIKPPYILATNHLTSWDPAMILAISPRTTQLTVLAADKWRKVLPILLLFNAMGGIWVKRGEVDRVALRASVKVLQNGGAMGMSPEGTRSRTGALIQGRSGVAYLALKADVPVIPIALWGVENIAAARKRLRRADVTVSIGEAMRMDRALSLDENTEHLMRTIAAMLPEQYRGVYA
jgi:1-acyl-sn-glycerol-3-phosphate acyltransferase